jgi:Tfp pilus assembly protein PilV
VAHGSESGFTFNELLAAMAITVVVVMGYSLASVHLIRRQIASDHSTVAIHLAQDKIEELQARQTLAESDTCPDAGDHGLSPETSVTGAFDRCWRIAPSPLGSALKQIDVTVSWRDHEDHEITLSTLFFTGE